METINDRIAQVVAQVNLSKTAFGERIRVSQQYVSKLVKNGVPSDRTISDICREFRVNEHWLRTGEGEMFLIPSPDEEIAAFIGDALSCADDSFKKRLVSALAKLDDRGWDALEKLIDGIEGKKKED